jgi:hypothetical protein
MPLQCLSGIPAALDELEHSGFAWQGRGLSARQRLVKADEELMLYCTSNKRNEGASQLPRPSFLFRYCLPDESQSQLHRPTAAIEDELVEEL